MSLSKTAETLMNIEQAQHYYQTVIKGEQCPNSIDDCITAGDLLLADNQWEAAIALYQTAINLQPDSASAHFKLGEALLEQQQGEAAITAYRQAIQLNPETFIFHVGLGKALAQQQQWDGAVTAYETAIQLNPNFSWAYHHLGSILQQQQRYDEAIAAYRKELRLNPQFYWSYLHLGDLLLKTHQTEAAIAIYEQAVALNPHQPEAKQRLKQAHFSPEQRADHLLQQHQWQAAEIAYQDAIALNRQRSWSYYGLGYARLKQNQWETAATAFQQGIEFNPDCSWFYSHLGYCQFKQGHIQAAIAQYHQALEINPDIPETHLRLGDIWVRQNQYHDAIAAYLQAIELQPNWQTPYIKLRHIETFHGVHHTPQQFDHIAQQYRQIIQAHPQQVEAYINLGNLQTKQGFKSEAITCYQDGVYQQTQITRPHFIQHHWHQSTIQGPQFLIIGVMKGGTTSLYEYLVQHPQVLPGLQKEIDFFNYQFNLGLDWYLSHFPPTLKHPVFLTGEASPTYLLDLETIPRVFEHFPQVKLLVILRNPVDRAISQYYDHFNWLGREKRSLAEAITSEMKVLQQLQDPTTIGIHSPFWKSQKGHLWRGLYVYFLEKWMQVFPREQFLILKSEDLYHQPQTTMEQVFKFLGLPPYRLQNYRQYTAGSYAQVNPEIREKLSHFFHPHNQRLAAFLGETLNWNEHL